ncbi:hypothetical protein H6771_02220 [Candidatus Peribacteria bacterium]|nr:hypothetical protein [Candidatus Peribacteria bacterium]
MLPLFSLAGLLVIAGVSLARGVMPVGHYTASLIHTLRDVPYAAADGVTPVLRDDGASAGRALQSGQYVFWENFTERENFPTPTRSAADLQETQLDYASLVTALPQATEALGPFSIYPHQGFTSLEVMASGVTAAHALSLRVEDAAGQVYAAQPLHTGANRLEIETQTAGLQELFLVFTWENTAPGSAALDIILLSFADVRTAEEQATLPPQRTTVRPLPGQPRSIEDRLSALEQALATLQQRMREG